MELGGKFYKMLNQMRYINLNVSGNQKNIKDASMLPPLVLAYVGDAVYELAVRHFLVSKGIIKPDRLHNVAVEFVKASAQKEMIFVLTDHLREDELNIVRRGRNARSNTPRECKVSDYKFSTAFEALIGYLYLKGDVDRLDDILNLVYKFKSEEYKQWDKKR